MADLTAVEAFWQSYLETLPKNHPHYFHSLPEAGGFGDSSEMADELGKLVLDGVKTATCGRYSGENLLDYAGLRIVLDGSERPLCLCETVEITVQRFCDVDVQFAFDEGEGDRSLAYWREAHRDFFTRRAEQDDVPFCEDMLLECERFRVLYRNLSLEPHP